MENTRVITEVETTNKVDVNLLVEENKMLRRLAVDLLRTDIIDRLVDPDAHPINGGSSNPPVETIIPVMELGGLDRSSGATVERDDAVRTKDFVPIIGGIDYKFSNGFDYKICMNLYDESKTLITAWNDGYNYGYVKDGNVLKISATTRYIKFYCSTTADTTVEFKIESVYEDTSTYLEFIKQYFANGNYCVQCTEMDPGLWQLEISSKDNEFAIVKIKAPSTQPHEATIALVCSGNGFRQIADLSCMRYDETAQGQVCLICQSRGETPLPYFFIGFNNGNEQGRVQKFRIEPDAIPLVMTKDGIRVRRNNNYDNKWNGEEATVNLATMYDKVEKMYTALLANGTITK